MEEIIKHTAKPNPKNATRLFITMFEIQEKVIRKRYKHRYIYFWDFFVVPVICLVAFIGFVAYMGIIIFKLFL